MDSSNDTDMSDETNTSERGINVIVIGGVHTFVFTLMLVIDYLLPETNIDINYVVEKYVSKMESNLRGKDVNNYYMTEFEAEIFQEVIKNRTSARESISIFRRIRRAFFAGYIYIQDYKDNWIPVTLITAILINVIYERYINSYLGA